MNPAKYKSQFVSERHDRRAPVHRDLASWLKDNVRNPRVIYEIVMLYLRWLKRGSVSLHQGRFQFCDGGAAMKEMRDVLKRCPYIRKIANGMPGHRSTTYKFELRGISRVSRPETQSTEDSHAVVLFVRRGYSTVVVVPGDWLWNRYTRWKAWVTANGHEHLLDLEGHSEQGLATLDAFEALEVKTDDIDLDSIVDSRVHPAGMSKRQYAAMFLDSMTKSGRWFFHMRRDGRTYHPLSSCPKVIRRACLIDGERLGESDLKSSYWFFLATKLRDLEERDQLLAMIHAGDFYERVAEAAGFEFVDRGELKKEFQRQCLFGRDWRLTDRPLWRGLGVLFPGLARFIEAMRGHLGVSGFAKYLMRLEGRLMDEVQVTLHRLGIKSLRLHDAMLVAESKLTATAETIEAVALDLFGIRPRVDAK